MLADDAVFGIVICWRHNSGRASGAIYGPWNWLALHREIGWHSCFGTVAEKPKFSTATCVNPASGRRVEKKFWSLKLDFLANFRTTLRKGCH